MGLSCYRCLKYAVPEMFDAFIDDDRNLIRLGFALVIVSIVFQLACTDAGISQAPDDSVSAQTGQSSGNCRGLDLVRERDAAFEANPYRAGIQPEYAEDTRICLEGEIIDLPTREFNPIYPGLEGALRVLVVAKINDDLGFILDYGNLPGHTAFLEEHYPMFLEPMPIDLTPEQQVEWGDKQAEIDAEWLALEVERKVAWESLIMAKSVGDTVRAECDLGGGGISKSDYLPEGTRLFSNCEPLE